MRWSSSGWEVTRLVRRASKPTVSTRPYLGVFQIDVENQFCQRNKRLILELETLDHDLKGSSIPLV